MYNESGKVPAKLLYLLQRFTVFSIVVLTEAISMRLELSSLNKAVFSLERSVKVAEAKLSQEIQVCDEIETIKAGVIQNFEFTYELCWKFMKRWIEENVSRGIVDGVTIRELFRVGAENRLINDVDEWMEYHYARNLTSHIYDQDVAEQVYKTAVSFFPASKEFLERLKMRND